MNFQNLIGTKPWCLSVCLSVSLCLSLSVSLSLSQKLQKCVYNVICSFDYNTFNINLTELLQFLNCQTTNQYNAIVDVYIHFIDIIVSIVMQIPRPYRELKERGTCPTIPLLSLLTRLVMGVHLLTPNEPNVIKQHVVR